MKNKQAKTVARSLKNSAEFDFFLYNSLTRYEGMYVAIFGRKVVASGKSAKEVWIKAKKKYPKALPTIAKIPKNEIMVMPTFARQRRFF